MWGAKWGVMLLHEEGHFAVFNIRKRGHGPIKRGYFFTSIFIKKALLLKGREREKRRRMAEKTA